MGKTATRTIFAGKRGLVGYVAIYLGWAWFFWSLVVLSGQSVWTFPNVLLFYVGAISPALGGILMVYRRSGVAGLRRLGNRIVDVRRIRPRWSLVIVGLYPAITLTAAGIAALVGAETTPLNPTEALERLVTPLSLFAFFGFTLGAGLVEETGSTGYFLDRLIAVWNPTVAGVVSGVVWASWHIPLFLMDGYYSQASYQPIVWRFFATFVFLETLYAWLYDNTDRSVLAAILFHLMINLTGEVLAPSQQVRWYAFYLTILVAVAVVGWRKREVIGQQVRSVGT
ncbi:CPBP family intramembrane metalloprotease [Haloferax sp. MBLA0076]|uniref:CPBP family intramembrane metalloprotease n=1 Tax=Haloferax litoreum TaxID=2666140 RepID=A0A6A8GJ13_9EURY|nr:MULTISPECIES: type II CAAX endopeptidase family protein [Haloferax]KAB1193203.1 CPBP family intramembrane metalloprotease [Haloferax sp. CBA1148]MRX21700.1 CPBP family intramembrane metalloprotease [Haloferax litoreum]